MLHLIVSSQGLYSFPAPLGSFEASFEIMGHVMAQPLTTMPPGNQCLPPAYEEFVLSYWKIPDATLWNTMSIR